MWCDGGRDEKRKQIARYIFVSNYFRDIFVVVCSTVGIVYLQMEKTKLYHAKLLKIKKEMHQLHEKSSKLKVRFFM